MREKIIQEILRCKLIAIVRGAQCEALPKIAQALYDGGVRLMEITFDQKHPDSFSATADGIRTVRSIMGENMHIGAGTVLTVEQVEMAAEAGAQYIISPDTDPAVIQRSRALGLVSIPGAYTPSEAKQAVVAGADFVKLFPCVSDAPAYLKAVCAPMSHIRFLAVGGVDVDNLTSFMDAGAVGIGVASSLVNKKWVEQGDFDRITLQARRFVEKLK